MEQTITKKHVVISSETHRRLAMACSLQVTTITAVADALLAKWADSILESRKVEVADVKTEPS